MCGESVNPDARAGAGGTGVTEGFELEKEAGLAPAANMASSPPSCLPLNTFLFPQPPAARLGDQVQQDQVCPLDSSLLTHVRCWIAAGRTRGCPIGRACERAAAGIVPIRHIDVQILQIHTYRLRFCVSATRQCLSKVWYDRWAESPTPRVNRRSHSWSPFRPRSTKMTPPLPATAQYTNTQRDFSCYC